AQSCRQAKRGVAFGANGPRLRRIRAGGGQTFFTLRLEIAREVERVVRAVAVEIRARGDVSVRVVGEHFGHCAGTACRRLRRAGGHHIGKDLGMCVSPCRSEWIDFSGIEYRRETCIGEAVLIDAASMFGTYCINATVLERGKSLAILGNAGKQVRDTLIAAS